MNILSHFNRKKLFRSFYISLLFILLLSLTACPDNDDCVEKVSNTIVNNLIKLTPEQTEYHQGDVLTLKVNIPTTNSYFGHQLNLFEETGDSSAELIMSSRLFNGNTLEFIKGQQGHHDNMFYLPYNPATNSYELEIKITLDQTGPYFFYWSGSVQFDEDGCNKLMIETNIEWNTYGMIDFIVVE